MLVGDRRDGHTFKATVDVLESVGSEYYAHFTVPSGPLPAIALGAVIHGPRLRRRSTLPRRPPDGGTARPRQPGQAGGRSRAVVRPSADTAVRRPQRAEPAGQRAPSDGARAAARDPRADTGTGHRAGAGHGCLGSRIGRLQMRTRGRWAQACAGPRDRDWRTMRLKPRRLFRKRRDTPGAGRRCVRGMARGMRRGAHCLSRLEACPRRRGGARLRRVPGGPGPRGSCRRGLRGADATGWPPGRARPGPPAGVPPKHPGAPA